MAVLYPEQGDAWMGFLVIGMVVALSYFPDTGKLVAKQQQLAEEETQQVDNDHLAAKQEDFPPLAREAQDQLCERKQRFDKLVQHWTFLSNPNSNEIEGFTHETTPDSVIGIPLFVDTSRRRRSRSRSRSLQANVRDFRSPRRPSLYSPMLKSSRSTERLSPTPRHSALGRFARVFTAPFQRNWLKTTLASSHLVGSSPRSPFQGESDSPVISSKSPQVDNHTVGTARRFGLANWLWRSR